MLFRLFAGCVPVQGAKRSVICDLQRQAVRFIPAGLYEILTEHRGKTVDEIKAFYEHEYDEEIDEYFQFLIRHELGFWCDEDPASFPDLDLTWDAPERITNAILDFDAGSGHDVPAILRQLDDLGCKALQVRFFSPCGPEDLWEILDAARHGRLRSIELLFPYSEALPREEIERLCAEFPRVSKVQVHSAPGIWKGKAPSGAAIVLSPQAVDSPACCGQVHPSYFAINIGHFTEGQKHNTCLNRKISIDARGEIRNCPSLPRSYGNAAEVSLHSALAQRDFTALWTVNKDQIEICKDCELRYICTDCRAYIQNPGDLYSKPSKCRYDPYTATWGKTE